MLLNDYEIFDSHLHIIDPRFSVMENNGYLPEPFTVKQYLTRTSEYKVIGGVVVTASYQGHDQTFLSPTLAELGNSYIGVTHVATDTTDKVIQELHQSGVRAARFNFYRCENTDIKQLKYFADRIYDLVGWHIELYINSILIESLFNELKNFPAISIDHLGLKKQGLKHLIRLSERGARVKATGFGRLDFDFMHALKDIYKANPKALMFGTDLPSTRAARPYRDQDFLLIAESFSTDQAKNIFSQNAIDFYQINK